MIYFIFHKDAVPIPPFTLNQTLRKYNLQFLKTSAENPGGKSKLSTTMTKKKMQAIWKFSVWMERIWGMEMKERIVRSWPSFNLGRNSHVFIQNGLRGQQYWSQMFSEECKWALRATSHSHNSKCFFPAKPNRLLPHNNIMTR